MIVIKKIKFKYILAGILISGGFYLYYNLINVNSPVKNSVSADCEKCRKNKAAFFQNSAALNEKTGRSGSGADYFSKILSTLNNNISGAGIIEGDEPEKQAAINEINSLSKNVCNDENLPDDIWISPKLIEQDTVLQLNELKKLISYCGGIKKGETTSEEKQEYYKIKIRLLEERKRMIKYSIETLDGQIEDTNEKKIADMENSKADDKITPEEEKINNEIEKENNRFYEETLTRSEQFIKKIDAVINNYKLELSKL